MKKTRIWTAAVIAAAIFTLCCYFMPFLKLSLDIFGEQIGTTSVSGFDTLKAALDGEFPYNGWYVIGFAGAVLALLFAVIALAKRGILVCTMLFGAASIAGTAFSVGKCIDYLGELYTAGAGFVLLIIAAALTIVLCVVTLALPKPAGMPMQPWQQHSRGSSSRYSRSRYSRRRPRSAQTAAPRCRPTPASAKTAAPNAADRRLRKRTAPKTCRPGETGAVFLQNLQTVLVFRVRV